MRRLRTVLVMLLVCLLSYVTAYGNGDFWTEKERIEYEANTNLLAKIGVMDEGKDITETITRGEFAKIIVSMLMNGETVKKSEDFVFSFSDINSKTPYASYIQTAYELGILTGYSDGTYRPDEMIHTEHAIVGFINAMGYSVIVDDKGGYPHGYLQIASDLKLLGGMDVRLGYDITRGELCKLIMNSLSVDFLLSYESQIVSKTDNRFLDYLKIEKYSGVVKATEHGTIIGTEKTAKNYININDKLFYVENNCDELLGYPVEFYVNSDEPTKIISINIDYGEYEELVIESRYIESYIDNQYTYEIDSKTKTESFPYNAYIVYNGTAISNATPELMQPKNGSVKLLDYNDDGRYDIVFITDYAICVVNTVNVNELAVYDMFGASRSLNFNDETEYDIENVYGEKISIEDLKKYDVLSVKQTQDKEYAKIILSTENISGKINTVREDYIAVDNVNYEIVGRDFYGTLTVTASGMFLLDNNNRIVAFINSSASEMKKGYLFKGNYNDEETPTIYLRIFAETGEILRVSTTEKITIDGVRKKADEAFEILKKGTDSLMPQLILFSMNDEGKVIKIDTPYNNAPAQKNNIYGVNPSSPETKDSLRLLLGMGSRTYWEYQMNFNGNKHISSSTVIFKVPTSFDNVSENDFAVLTPGELEGDRAYDIELYSTNANNLTADIAVTTSKGMSSSKYGVITDIEECLNEYDEVVTKAVFTYDNKVSTIYITENTELSGVLSSDSSVPNGSFVRVSIGNENNANSIYVLYNSETKELNGGKNPTGSYYETNRIIVGNVYNKENDVIALTLKDVEKEVIKDSDIETHIPSAFRCYEYDTTARKPSLRKITEDEIVDYMHGGRSYSKVLVYTYYGADPRMMIVYK